MIPRVFIYRLPQDDPRKNTAIKLVRFGFAQLVDSIKALPSGSIILDPTVKTPLTPSDRVIAESRGLSLIDCSWKRAVDVHTKFIRGKFIRRRLPLLIAANPTHYGKPYILSTIEAVAAALYIMGFKDEAMEVLRLYKWGPNFIIINQKYLERYAAGDLSPERELLGVDDVDNGLEQLMRVLTNGD
ncbi:DUF367 family protein [Vulcanisaeta distributa]|uniref:16S rRNA aminocarboxypropyltransferase n=1 Tax=Vulcanisaeta distributa (strain DSM 14429 / JCM 11212 / NBRC 100878 / IC-017) TaxID=572478 RepID=TSR3_VULDI|nr:DUF367 family protein [Vulcanisaeta distributa]E1QU22.1 RecName: Full=16S rRNA aminocarboxypropyltransferase; AltName: Full=20S S rRNA accumulation protein 3 homolog; Short=VdTsr3 [Vulcanisaeta distributa DSM 14429]ADN49819.1 Protein of unknown function DUF367 [Vulcanisaeta distributa DSM 14429]